MRTFNFQEIFKHAFKTYRIWPQANQQTYACLAMQSRKCGGLLSLVPIITVHNHTLNSVAVDFHIRNARQFIIIRFYSEKPVRAQLAGSLVKQTASHPSPLPKNKNQVMNTTGKKGPNWLSSLLSSNVITTEP